MSMMQTDKTRPISLREIRSFHTSGRRVELADQPRQQVRVSPNAAPREVDLNGHYICGQLYAQHFQLAAPLMDLPVLFWHGGAMSGVTWETTPDGREGWANHFLRAGYDVVVSDAVERGRSSWAPFPQIYPDVPLFRTQEDAWSLFRMGPKGGFSADPTLRKAYVPQRFPLERFDQLCAQFVPRWTTNTEITEAAYRELIEGFDKAIIIAHSQGCWFAQRIAARYPDRVAAVVLVEPAGAPEVSAAEFAAAATVPHLFLWGDHCSGLPAWEAYRSDADARAAGLARAGGIADVVDLPARGIYGNSHMPMMDDNSAALADLVLDWLARVRPEGVGPEGGR